MLDGIPEGFSPSGAFRDQAIPFPLEGVVDPKAIAQPDKKVTLVRAEGEPVEAMFRGPSIPRLEAVVAHENEPPMFVHIIVARSFG
jgi:hypothetical protein